MSCNSFTAPSDAVARIKAPSAGLRSRAAPVATRTGAEFAQAPQQPAPALPGRQAGCHFHAHLIARGQYPGGQAGGHLVPDRGFIRRQVLGRIAKRPV
jgi:hypothetical protein